MDESPGIDPECLARLGEGLSFHERPVGLPAQNPGIPDQMNLTLSIARQNQIGSPSVKHKIAGPALISRDYWDTTGHGLEDHQSKIFCDRAMKKQIRRWIRTGQCGPGANSSEDNVVSDSVKQTLDFIFIGQIVISANN
ncbi:hypothetical protein Pdw03_6082 [Penicillium digitatum]|uniref:Uncharacterized protein n=1 Tax=Penicillium digitatum TaxID=36651 RepID=A0A7T6XW73_PENDI|nr:hypothetical protein Pdw03_6082 [Penicillium digitatum]